MANQYKNKVVYNGTTLIDLSQDTVTSASHILKGYVGHLADGAQVTGTAESGGGTVTWETLYEGNATIVSSSPNYIAINNFSETIGEDETWRITWDGVEYVCTPQYSSQIGGCFIGNSTIVGGSDSGNNEPFWAYKRTSTQLAFSTNQSAGTIALVIERQTTSSATLITKTITANGTYSASDDSADGYSEVTVNVPSGGASKNVQTAQSTTRRNNTALGSITSLTCSTAGTYDVYWSCARSNTSQTWGSQLYINGTAYGTENTTWSNNVQNNHLTGVTISANATVAVYGRSRSGYYIYVPQLTIEQTA